MPRRPAAYPAAYREQIIALARTGRISSALLRRAAVLKNDLAGLKKLADADPPGLHAL